MQILVVIRVLGLLLSIFSVTMFVPGLVSLYFDDGAAGSFFKGFAITLIVGLLAYLPLHDHKAPLKSRDGFVIVVSFSKLYLPRDYQIKQIFESFYSFKDVIHHNKYKNNYDYNNATLILTNQKFLTNDFLILKEDESIGSRIATLHYEFYDDRQTLLSSLSQHEEELQCISAKDPLESKLYVPLGSCQQPTLSDYADHVDTISFLTSLS